MNEPEKPDETQDEAAVPDDSAGEVESIPGSAGVSSNAAAAGAGGADSPPSAPPTPPAKTNGHTVP